MKARLETAPTGKSIKRERIATAPNAGNPLPMATVSFQSHVAAGAVGNSAAAMVYQAFGQSLWAIPTVLYSNHPAGRAFAGESVAPNLLRRFADAFATNGLIDQVARVQSGYLGAPGQGDAILTLLAAARKSGRTVSYVCDPVMGDREAGLYVSTDVAAAIRDTLVPAADAVTPNLFELEYLSGAPVESAAQVWAAMRSVQAAGPSIVVATSVVVRESTPDHVDTFLLEGDEGWSVSVPRIQCPAHGAGDIMTAAFLARMALGDPPPRALSLAVSSVHAILRAAGDQPDLALHVAQSDLTSPAPVFPAVPTRLSSDAD